MQRNVFIGQSRLQIDGEACAFLLQIRLRIQEKSRTCVVGRIRGLAAKLVAFLKWAVTDGQKITATLDYAPLPDNVVQRELALLGTIK